jgi:hypothetical protein
MIAPERGLFMFYVELVRPNSRGKTLFLCTDVQMDESATTFLLYAYSFYTMLLCHSNDF